MDQSLRPVFLTAHWQHLIMLNYEVPAHLLQAHVPKGTELHLWEGKALVSVVGFLFKHTKVFGLHWPWHTHFEEINLRLYVRRASGSAWRNGVAFVSEIVPRPAIAIIANTLYNEHYRYMPTRHSITQPLNGRLAVSYGCKKQGIWHTMQVEAHAKAEAIAPQSIESFIFNRAWGYNQLSANKTIEYAVEHEPWQVHAIKTFNWDGNVEQLYGSQWLPHLCGKPHSVMMAKGSPVVVRKPTVITLPF
ncbi:MAG: DUF2071 domain-containing protein [Bacteroidetes bacterium]|nr:MAG: DUF2071 domain-containing protein [Bacteroidota bacterium]